MDLRWKLFDENVKNIYLECGSNKGDPSGGAGVCKPDEDAVAAWSGCKKFLLWSTRSWCCDKHLCNKSGSASICS